MVAVALIALIAAAVSFCGTVAVTVALLALFSVKARVGAAACFVSAAITVSSALVAICSSSPFFRYSAEGPVIWFVVWPILGCVLLAVLGAALAVPRV
jgi:hypothetical protein